jgi:hypothetical protein
VKTLACSVTTRLEEISFFFFFVALHFDLRASHL